MSRLTFFSFMHKMFFLVLFQMIISGLSSDRTLSFYERLSPVPKESGFKMKGYWVWGGSLIKVDNKYHLFASRWPKKNKFPDDYFKESEIVRATSDSPTGPFEFQEVVIGERDSTFWDSNMAHNPTIHKIGNDYVIFYIGSDFTSKNKNNGRLIRRIGFATSKSILGPWSRSDFPVIAEESNNPAILVEDNLKVIMMYRDENLKVKMANAKSFSGPYSIVNEDVWPNEKLEDFYLFKEGGKYHCICEDNEGMVTGHVRWGAHIVSANGIDKWEKDSERMVYDHKIKYTNGDSLFCERRERPQLFIEEGKAKYLLTGVYDGQDTWCQPVPLIPAFPVD